MVTLGSMEQKRQFSIYSTRFLYPIRSDIVNLRRLFPCANALGYAAALVVNAALVVSEWQNCV